MVIELAKALEGAGFVYAARKEWTKGTITVSVRAFVTVTDSTNPGAKCLFSQSTAIEMAKAGSL